MNPINHTVERVPMYGPHTNKCVTNVPAPRVSEYEARGYRRADADGNERDNENEADSEA